MSKCAQKHTAFCEPWANYLLSGMILQVGCPVKEVIRVQGDGINGLGLTPIYKPFLGGGNSKIFYFHPYLGEMIQFDEHIFQRGWFNHQLDL